MFELTKWFVMLLNWSLKFFKSCCANNWCFNRSFFMITRLRTWDSIKSGWCQQLIVLKLSMQYHCRDFKVRLNFLTWYYFKPDVLSRWVWNQIGIFFKTVTSADLDSGNRTVLGLLNLVFEMEEDFEFIKFCGVNNLRFN